MANQSPILLVEDNEDDIILIRMALRRAGVTAPFQIARDGQEALAWLSRTGDDWLASIDGSLPQLLLLDLKMPGIDGFEVLWWVRNQPRFDSLPIVVLTSSLALRDLNKALQMGADAFLIKPPDFANDAELVATTKRFLAQTQPSKAALCHGY